MSIEVETYDINRGMNQLFCPFKYNFCPPRPR